MKTPTISKIGFFALALSASLAGAGHAQNPQSAPRLILNGQPFRTQTAPVVQNNRVLVPLRDIFEGLGATVRFNARNRVITARREGTIVRMELGSTLAQVNGRATTLDVPATSVFGRTLVPLRFVSEALGATVRFNANRGIVRISDRSFVESNAPGRADDSDIYPPDSAATNSRRNRQRNHPVPDANVDNGSLDNGNFGNR